MDEKQQALNDFKKALKAGMPNPEKELAHLSDQLSSFYRKYLKDLKAQLKTWLELYDQMSFSDQLQVERLLNVANVINELVGEPGINIQQSIKGHILKQGTDAYNSVWYELEQGSDILLDFDVLDPHYLETIMEQPVAGKRLSKRLGDNVNQLAKASNNAISRGFMQGKAYADIARDISTETQASYKRAVRIARTESGRVSSISTQKGYKEATNKGIDLKKMWLATLDGRTREDHQHVDGQIRDIDKMFKVGGHDALGPHQVGIASEDINCRCTTRPIVHGIAPTVRRNNITGEIEKWQSYDEWVKKANKNHEVEMSKNERADKEQYKKWKSVGIKLPSFEEWQKIKYNSSEEWDKLKFDYRNFKRWSKAEFPTEKSYNGHYKSHGSEFPNLNQSEYKELARKVLAQPINDRYLGYDLEHRHIRYDSKENIYALGNGKGKITTMFKPDERMKYYEQNKQRDIDD